MECRKSSCPYDIILIKNQIDPIGIKKLKLPFHWYQSAEVKSVCAPTHPLLPPEYIVKSVSPPASLAAMLMTNTTQTKKARDASSCKEELS